MYAFVDRPVNDLEPGGRLLVWAMRSWVLSMGRKTCPGAVIGKAFLERNMIAGLQPFLRMMALFNRGGLENFEFCRLACNRVSEHEAILLQLVSEVRGDHAMNVRNTLPLLVEDEYSSDLFDSILAFGAALGRAGLCKPPTKGR
ncbi:hypothetical protein [Sphingobium sp. TKS]|uniref:hypothetical protein n=1 Tax=Sphingobium sp. TKS TaxID=1315974 RepID=UPI0007704BC4|nr:hypothetical protein [Sphingobium sp. TKS]AMK21614.1 hypothetical protein K426_03290 [Sphingobium sp. TKS]